MSRPAVPAPGTPIRLRPPRADAGVLCGYECYRQHQLGAVLMSWPFSQLRTVSTSKSVAASRRLAVEAIAMSGSMAYWSCTSHTWGVLRSLNLAFLSAHELVTLEGGDS